MADSACVDGVDPVSNPKIGTKATMGIGSMGDKGKNYTTHSQGMPARSAPSLAPRGARAPSGPQGHG